MRRLTLIQGIAASAAWPIAVRAQQSDQRRRVGVLMTNAENDPEGQSDAKAIRDGLKETGWTAERNVQIDFRWAAGNSARIRAFAKELVWMRPDIILARSTPAVAALNAETSTTPIVFTTVSDPIGSRFVASFAHPGATAEAASAALLMAAPGTSQPPGKSLLPSLWG